MIRLRAAAPLVLVACAGPVLDRAPDSLAGVPLHHTIEGRRALQAVDRLHRNGAVPLDAAWIASYGTGARPLMVYVGVAPDATAAEAMQEAMRETLEAGRAPFRYVRETLAGGRLVQIYTGQGQTHFVFSAGRKIVWLSADTARARRALAEALGARPDAFDEQSTPAGAAPGDPGSVHGLGPHLHAMARSSALDPAALERTLEESGSPLTDRQREVLRGADLALAIEPHNARFLLNALWSLGLVNANPILTRGPMVARSGGSIGRFASTGGWKLGPRPATEVYASRRLVPLTSDERERLERVVPRVARPCCDNATDFPDCNHGMAMLGLLTLAAGRGADDDALVEAALAANRIWFPRQTAHVEAFLRGRGAHSPRASVSPALATASGHRQVMARLEGPLPGGAAAASAC